MASFGQKLRTTLTDTSWPHATLGANACKPILAFCTPQHQAGLADMPTPPRRLLYSLWLAVTARRKNQTAKPTHSRHPLGRFPAHSDCLCFRAVWRKEVPRKILTAAQPAGKTRYFSAQGWLCRCTRSPCVARLPVNLKHPLRKSLGCSGVWRPNCGSITNLDGREWSVKYFKLFCKSAHLRCFMTGVCKWGLRLFLTTGVFAFVKLKQRDFDTQEMYLCLWLFLTSPLLNVTICSTSRFIN